jgi:hypothetical protein
VAETGFLKLVSCGKPVFAWLWRSLAAPPIFVARPLEALLPAW